MPALSEVVLRPVVPADAAAMATLHVDAWEEAYADLMPAAVLAERRRNLAQRVDRWRTIIDSSPATTTVAEHDGELVGFSSVGPGRSDDLDVAEELWALYVRASWWGDGLGHRMLRDGLGDRPAYLWVLRGNQRGIGFYQRQGFVLDGAAHDDPPFGTELRMVRR
ncbi:GNAT family N-acetyltransferase [Nocardioides panacisoli]|uniref:GNAT family N-acetyltransferase n=1 Tax=Nocardioides panacisoli TaxID=627624 RepID=UPI001C63B2D1|nr:GNAT family N-acetyltransferase [Nocardioides panacisoli]QYJ03794.1 GNAT family N-acetyltransferase [Nocardioides panacisoli]